MIPYQLFEAAATGRTEIGEIQIANREKLCMIQQYYYSSFYVLQKCFSHAGQNVSRDLIGAEIHSWKNGKSPARLGKRKIHFFAIWGKLKVSAFVRFFPQTRK